MKLNELITEHKDWYRKFSAFSNVCKILQTYIDKDCVVAYAKCFMGCVVLIKGKKSLFGFVSADDNNIFNMSYRIRRREIAEIMKILSSAEETKVVNQEVYDMELKKMLVENI